MENSSIAHRRDQTHGGIRTLIVEFKSHFSETTDLYKRTWVLNEVPRKNIYGYTWVYSKLAFFLFVLLSKHTPEHEKDNVKLEVFGLWQTEIYVPPPVKDVRLLVVKINKISSFLLCKKTASILVVEKQCFTMFHEQINCLSDSKYCGRTGLSSHGWHLV